MRYMTPGKNPASTTPRKKRYTRISLEFFAWDMPVTRAPQMTINPGRYKDGRVRAMTMLEGTSHTT